MIYELNDTTKAEKLFDGWEETLVYSCLQKVMGKILSRIRRILGWQCDKTAFIQ